MRPTSVAAMAVAILIATSGAAIAGNYVLTIDGKPYEIDLGAPATVALQDGRRVQIALEKKDVAIFKTANFAFGHPSFVTPSRRDLGDGVFQTIMTTPSGSLIMVQEYAGIDPSGIVDFVLNALLKEEVQYGYDIKRSDASRKLADGTTISGRRALSRYKNDQYERNVLCHSARDSGITVITQVEKSAPREDLAMVELFWKTLTISVK